MAIPPRFQLGQSKRLYFASKEFTNRISFRRAFKDAVEQLTKGTTKNETYKIITYYGAGGIGKSSLLQQLKKELSCDYPNVGYSAIDFIDPSYRLASRSLLELKRNIVSQKKIRFPHFELAYSLHFKKKNPDFVFKEKKLPFQEDASIIGDILGTFDGLGIAVTVTGVVSKAYKLFSKYGLEKEIKETLSELETFSAIEIEERLPAFFAYDLRRNIEKKLISGFVIFIDTYEALWEEGKNMSNQFTRDSWVRELIAQLPETLFIISGREKIRWEEMDLEWSHYLEQHLIENLADEDSDIFLRSCGIKEDDVREKIISSSGGHPYHLDLSVDLYFELKNQGEEITSNQFGSNKRQVLDRFLRNLKTPEIETLKLLSIPRFYNEEIFEFLIKTFMTGYPLSKFEEFNRFSFIRSEKNRYFLHDLMRDSLNEIQSSNIIKKVHEVLANFYSDLLAKNKDAAIQDNLIDIFAEANFHRYHHLNKEDYQKWLSVDCYDFLKYLQLCGAANFLEKCLFDIANYLGIKHLDIKLFSILVDMVHLMGNYKKAVEMIEKYLGQYKMEEIIISDEFLHLYIRRIHHQMFFHPVSPLIKDLLVLVEKIDQQKSYKRYNELLFMIGGNLGVLTGNFQFSRKWLVKSIRFAISNHLPDYLCRTLRKYSDVLRFYGHLENANKFCNWGLNVAKDNQFTRYEIYLISTKAEIFREQKLYNKAIEYYKNSQEMARQQGIRGWVAHGYIGLGECFLAQRNIKDAKDVYAKAKVIYDQIGQVWGQIQVNIGIVRCLLMEGNKEWGKLAIETYKISKQMGYKKDEDLLKALLKHKIFYSNKLMFL